MPKISSNTIHNVKNSVLISDVFEWLGAKVVRRGSSYMAFCPFCDDATSRTPACSLSDEMGLFHCFRCNASGDTINAVMRHEECNFPEAVEQIATQFNVPIEYDASDDPEAESRRKHLVSVLEAAQLEFIAQRDDKHYKDFLCERSLSDEDAEKFELSISLYTRADDVVRRLQAKFDDESLINSGICFKNDSGGLVLRFRNRIMFPIRTAPGTLIGFGARDITGKAPAKYKNSPESMLFHKRNVMYGMNTAKRAMMKSKRTIVCEGYMDTIALQTHGFEYSIGAMGTALTESNIRKLSNFANTIYLSLDSDKAGISAAMRTAETIPSGLESDVRVLTIPEVECRTVDDVKRVSPNKANEYLFRNVPDDPAYPDGKTHKEENSFPMMVPMAKDPDEFFNQSNHTHDEFEKILENSHDLFLFCAMHMLKKYTDTINAELAKSEAERDNVLISREKQNAKNDMRKWMSRVYNKMNIYQRQNIGNYMTCALRLVETFDDLNNEWEKAARMSGRWNVNNGKKNDDFNTPVFSSERTEEEDLLIATLYYHPEARKAIKENINDIMSVFTNDTRKNIFNKIDATYGSGGDIKHVNDDMTDQESAEFARIVMKNEANEQHGELGEDAIRNICRRIERHSVENMIEQESSAGEPDIMKLIDLKMKLTKLS